MAPSPQRSARDRAANNFDALRLGAALMVLAGHAYVLSGRAAAEPLAAWTGIGGLGELGVSIFFVISGFLVTMSCERSASTAAYLAKRVLRIAPGLAVSLALTAWLLGPLVTSLAPADYFGRPQTWLYVVRNLLLYPVTYLLPGVFEHNPYPGAVNGSLWTLRLEFTFYLVLPVLARAGRLDRRGLTALAAVAAVAYLVLAAVGHPPVLLIAARNFWLFAAGAALYAWRGAPALARPLWPALALVAFVASLPFRPATPLVAPLALPLLVTALALRPLPVLRSTPRLGDLSYGVYIYAFPVQQALMQVLGPDRLGVPAFVGLTLAAVLPIAALSWRLVERPALGLKPVVAEWLGGRTAPPAPLRAVEPL